VEITVLMAHPTLLRDLVERYERLTALQAEGADAETRRRIEDVSYTLCVSTGTRTIDAALAAATEQLAPAGNAVSHRRTAAVVAVADAPAEAQPA
jgi:hypothetical protein